MANRFDHLIDNYEKEYNVKVDLRKDELTFRAIFTMRDVSSGQVWHYAIDDKKIWGFGEADKHVTNIIHELGYNLRAARKKEGRDEKTGFTPITYAAPRSTGSYGEVYAYMDEYGNFPLDPNALSPQTKPKVKPNYSKLKNFGIY